MAERLEVRSARQFADTTFTRVKYFGDGLFKVSGTVDFNGSRFRQDVQLQQLRDIRLAVVNTFTQDRSGMLTYVTSPDFQDLQYQTFTELKRKKRLPWFWIGLAGGITLGVLTTR